jgi:pimeloyl-ACP methyl ester carboxylesterase
MPRTRWWWIASTLLGIGVWLAALPAAADPADNPGAALDGTSIRSVMVRLPQGAASSEQPLQVLLALHGMGGNGTDFSRDLIQQADRYGWVIVAPTIEYGDWTNPAVVANEDPMLIQALSDYLDGLPRQLATRLHRKVLVLGHSRGAQLAHRFAEFQPERVLAVAAISAGTYTMPIAQPTDGNLQFPFGVEDLQAYAGHPFDREGFEGVAVWVAVGGQDTNPADVPRQWDRVEGSNRVQRAQAFEAAAQQLGADAVLRIFSSAHHELTPEMRSEACDFLETATLAQDSRTLISIPSGS